MNSIKKIIEQNRDPVGTFIFSRSQAAIEVLAEIGYDFAVIGAEHFMVNPEKIEQLITAAEAAGIVPYVRVQENTDLIQRVLDCGAEGIISPMIDNVEEAREIVNVAKFPPIGSRGVGNPRSTNYGIRGGDYLDRCYEKQNKNQSVILQIETEESLVNIKEIASTRGVDSLFIGPWDLSHSLNQTDRDGGEKLLEDKINVALRECKKSDTAIGIFSWGSEEATRRLEQGFDYVICGGDVIFLANSAKEELENIKNKFN